MMFNRRQFLRTVCAGAASAMVPWRLGAAARPAPRPNILLIMADDLGFSDLGCYGSEIRTPNLNRLATGGLRFSQFYNTAKCAPSRVSLLTGLYPNQAGGTSLSRGVTIAEVLRRAGYTTMMTGKWHLKDQPTDRGFDRYFGHLSGCTNYFKGDKTFRLNGEVWDKFDKDFYTTDANTDYMLRFLDEALGGDKPFFAYIAYNAPHYPLQVRQADWARYKDTYTVGWDALREVRYARQLKLGLFKKPWKLSPRPREVPAWETLSDADKKWEADRMAAFAGMVDCLDRNIGRLIANLKDKGVLDNTLILFCSDNGACPFERTRGKELRPWDPKSHWTYDVGWAHMGNTPFRWYKQWQHEGGISSPLVVHWPDGIKADRGSVTHQPGHLIDVMATCADLGGATYPRTFGGAPIEPLMGRSLAPIFRGEQRKGHDWIYQAYGPNRALRQGDWKIVSSRSGAWELYDLAEDRTELTDLASQYPDRVKAMAKTWHEVTARLGRSKVKPVKAGPVEYRFKRQRSAGK